ncbi:hypothetical protein [Roseobacter sp.]|uniref:hypothetical protein n=1 Tax=Roseobacter sp. TaxID=1907202 RepID=UPI003299DC07
MTFDVTGFGASIHPVSGQLSLDTAASTSATMISVTALNSAGTAKGTFDLIIQAALAPPTKIADLNDEIFDEDTGIETIDVSGVFLGDDLTFSVTGLAANIDPVSGLLSLDTATPIDAASIVVVATNAAGSASAAFKLTIEADEPPVDGAPIEVYFTSFDTDRTSDFIPSTSGISSLRFDPTATFSGDPTPGAMTWGTPGDTNSTNVIFISVDPNRTYQLLYRSTLSGTGSNTEDTSLRMQDDSGTTLWNSGDLGTGTHLVEIPASSDAAIVRFDAKIRGTIASGSSKRYSLHMLGLWDITDSGGFPQKAAKTPFFWSEKLYTGLSSRPIDFTEFFTGNITEYIYDGPEPHTWDGAVLTITPTVDTAGQGDAEDGTVTRLIYAMNGPLRAVDPQVISINVSDSTTLTPLTERTPGEDWQIEVGRPMPSFAFSRGVYGGAQPHSYTVLSKPDWVTVEDNGVCHGTPDRPTPRTPLTVQVTDALGNTLEANVQIEAVALRDRTPVRTIPSGGVIFDEIRKYASSGGVLALEEDGTYTWGNSFGAVNATQSNPTIVTGPVTAVVNGRVEIDSCIGLVFEGFTVTRSITESASKDYRAQMILGTQSSCLHINFFDLTIRGNRLDVVAPGASADAGADWENTESFVTMGVGITTGGNFPVVHRCAIENVYAGINLDNSKHFTVQDCTVRWIGVDGLTTNKSMGGVIKGNRFQEPVGNYTSYTHRDLLQTFGNNAPQPNHFCWLDNFASCSGVDLIQGHLFDQDGWGNSDKTPRNGTNYRHIYRGNTVFNSTNAHGANLEYYHDSIFEQFSILPHPDVSRTALIYLRFACQILLKDCLINGYTGSGYDSWFHLVDRENTIDMSTAEAPDFSTIFPNWANPDLAFEDPREAVINGQPPSAARFWIDPASSWNASNPKTAPSWLRDGL